MAKGFLKLLGIDSRLDAQRRIGFAQGVWRKPFQVCGPVAPPGFLMSRLGLGVTSFILWTVADDGLWLSTAELAARADLSARTARKYLPRLHSAGMLDRANGKWIRIGTDDDINAVEEILIGGNKRIFIRNLLDQQVEWKLATDRIRDGETQEGHSGKG